MSLASLPKVAATTRNNWSRDAGGSVHTILLVGDSKVAAVAASRGAEP